MPRYVALLRGVSPLNASMPALQRCFEGAGFTAVRTVLGSGNVVFDHRGTSEAAIEREAEAAMKATLPTAFRAIVRPLAHLRELLDQDPFAGFDIAADAKRVVSFLRAAPAPAPVLPPEKHGARILCVRGREALCVYVPGPYGPVFMTVIERTFGKDITTRTWDTVRKCAAA